MCKYLALEVEVEEVTILMVHRQDMRTGRIITCFALNHFLFASEGGHLSFVYATSVGDVYGQRFKVGRIADDGGRKREKKFPVPATHQCPTFTERIQSM